MLGLGNKVREVDSHALHVKTEKSRYLVAKKCQHFVQDSRSAPCLWHTSYCLHPSKDNHKKTGMYTHCDLVWRGECTVSIEK